MKLNYVIGQGGQFVDLLKIQESILDFQTQYQKHWQGKGYKARVIQETGYDNSNGWKTETILQIDIEV